MKPLKNDLKEFLKTHINEEAVIKWNVSKATIQRWRHSYNLTYLEVKHGDCPKKFTDIQGQILNGNI